MTGEDSRQRTPRDGGESREDQQCWELGCQEQATETIVGDAGRQVDVCREHAEELVDNGGCEYV